MSDAKVGGVEGGVVRRVRVGEGALNEGLVSLVSFAGRVVLVTGAGQGIGRASALLFAQAGAAVVVTDIAMDRVEETAQLISDIPESGGVLALQHDVCKKEDAERVVREAVRTFGRVDVLVNNAGIFPLDSFDSFDEERWDRIFSVNCKGLLHTTRAFVAALTEQQKSEASRQHAAAAVDRAGPSIVHVSSVSGERANPIMFSYSASKGAVTNMTTSMAVRLAKQGIRVNAVCPGVVSSAGAVGALSANLLTKIGNLNPLGGRNILPEEVASTIFFLASPLASFVTGTTVRVDGGALAKL